MSRSIRRCGLCREPGHSVNTCRQAQVCYDRLLSLAENMRRTHLTREQYLLRIKDNLMSSSIFSAQEIKILAVRYFSYSGEIHTKQVHASFLAEKVTNFIQESNTQEEVQDPIRSLERLAAASVHRRRILINNANWLNQERERFQALRDRNLANIQRLEAINLANLQRLEARYLANHNEFLQERINNFERIVRSVREHGQRIQNGEFIVSNMNTRIEAATTDLLRINAVDNALALIYTALRPIQAEVVPEVVAEAEVVANQARYYRITATILCTESEAELQELKECPICYSDETKMIDMLTTNCNHEFCLSCICSHIDSIELNRKVACPMCRADITNFVVKNQDFYQIINRKYNCVYV
jgi:hypothetical protein